MILLLFWIVCGIVGHGFFHATQMRDEPYPYTHGWKEINNQDCYKMWAFSVLLNLVFGPLCLIFVLGSGMFFYGWLLTPRDYQ